MEVAVRKALLKHIPKIAVGGISALAALYIGLSPRLAPRLYSSRLFHPYKFPEGSWDTVELEGVPREDVWFTAVDGARVHGWFFDTPGARKTILFSHGNTGNITGRLTYLRLLIQAGVAVLIYDYRGYGRSDGEPTVRSICEDGVRAFDYLVQERGVRPAEIVLYGESLGTAVACEIAAERSCSAIILQSGFSSLKKIGEDQIPITKLYPQVLFPKPFLNTADRMAARQGYPLLVIHGNKDLVVPFSHAEEVFARASEPKRLVQLPECAHSDIWCTAPEYYVRAVREFVAELPS